MENEVYIRVEGMKGQSCEKKISQQISKMPGVEMVQVNAHKGSVSVNGGDLDQLEIIDIIEGSGYSVLR